MKIYYLKTMRTFKYLAIILIILLTLGSCKKIEKLSPIPYIKFTSFAVVDSIDNLNNRGGILNFYFEDGDGDIGLESPQISHRPDSLNLFLTLYRKIGNSMVPVPDGDLMKPSAYTIPYMERTGQNKLLKGTISVAFSYTFYEPKDSDVFRYDFYITDRAGHMSDTASTCEIPFSIFGLYRN